MTEQRNYLEGAGDDKLLSEFEFQPIKMFRISENRTVDSFELPYRLGLLNYLN